MNQLSTAKLEQKSSVMVSPDAAVENLRSRFIDEISKSIHTLVFQVQQRLENQLPHVLEEVLYEIEEQLIDVLHQVPETNSAFDQLTDHFNEAIRSALSMPEVADFTESKILTHECSQMLHSLEQQVDRIIQNRQIGSRVRRARLYLADYWNELVSPQRPVFIMPTTAFAAMLKLTVEEITQIEAGFFTDSQLKTLQSVIPQNFLLNGRQPAMTMPQSEFNQLCLPYLDSLVLEDDQPEAATETVPLSASSQKIEHQDEVIEFEDLIETDQEKIIAFVNASSDRISTVMNNINQAGRQRGITTRLKLEQLLGISAQYHHALLRGETDLQHRVIARAITEIGITTEELFGELIDIFELTICFQDKIDPSKAPDQLLKLLQFAINNADELRKMFITSILKHFPNQKTAGLELLGSKQRIAKMKSGLTDITTELIDIALDRGYIELQQFREFAPAPISVSPDQFSVVIERGYEEDRRGPKLQRKQSNIITPNPNELFSSSLSFSELSEIEQEHLLVAINEVPSLRKIIGAPIHAQAKIIIGGNKQIGQAFAVSPSVVPRFKHGLHCLTPEIFAFAEKHNIDISPALDLAPDYLQITIPRDPETNNDSEGLAPEELKHALRIINQFPYHRDALIDHFFGFLPPDQSFVSLGERLGVNSPHFTNLKAKRKTIAAPFLQKAAAGLGFSPLAVLNSDDFSVSIGDDGITIKLSRKEAEAEMLAGISVSELKERLEQIAEEEGTLKHLASRLTLLAMLHLDLEKQHQVASAFGFYGSYFDEIKREGRFPLELFFKADELGIDIKKILDGDTQQFGVPLELVEHLLQSTQRSAKNKSILVDNFIKKVKPPRSKKISPTAISNRIGCSRAAISKLIKHKQDPQGYSLSLMVFLRAHRKTRLKITHLLQGCD